MEENNSQQFGNLISQQNNNSKLSLPPSAVDLIGEDECWIFIRLILAC